DSRSGEVQEGDEDQGPASGPAGISYLRYCEEANDYVWQTSSTDHQRQGEQEHVQLVVDVSSVGSETKISNDLIQLVQQRHAGLDVGTEHAQHRNRVARQLH